MTKLLVRLQRLAPHLKKRLNFNVRLMSYVQCKTGNKINIMAPARGNKGKLLVE